MFFPIGTLVLIIIFSFYQAARGGSSNVTTISIAPAFCSSSAVFCVLGPLVFLLFLLGGRACPFYDRLRPVPDQNLNSDVYPGHGVVDDVDVFPEEASASPARRAQPLYVASEVAFQKPF